MIKLFRSKKFIISVLLFILIIYGISHYIKSRHDSNSQMHDAVVVEVDKAKLGSIKVEVQAIGTLVAPKTVKITTEVAGQVAKIWVQDGAFVKKGAPIIQLDDSVNKAKAESAKAKLIYSESSYNRMVLLGKKGAVSQQAIDQALADLKEKRAAAQESQTLAEKMLISAPFDGVLGKIGVNLGDYVTVGQDLVSLTDKFHLRVEYNIPEKYYSLIKLGQAVSLVASAYPQKEFSGNVAYISSSVNTQDHTISVYADVPNDDGLLTAGLFTKVTQSLGDEDHVVLVPAVCLVATIDGQEVYKVVDDKIVAVPVVIGQRTTNHVQIIKGLQPDDVVVISGQQKVKDGSHVSIKTS